jgi:hypothetical protein
VDGGRVCSRQTTSDHDSLYMLKTWEDVVQRGLRYVRAYRMVVLGYNTILYNPTACRTAWYVWDTGSEKMRAPRANENMQARARANENRAMQVTANENTVR